MCCADLASMPLNAVVEANFAVLGTVVARGGVQLDDGNTGNLSQMQQVPEELHVVDIGSGEDGTQLQAVGCNDNVVLASRFAAVGGIRAGRRTVALGSHRTAVDHQVPGCGLG